METKVEALVGGLNMVYAALEKPPVQRQQRCDCYYSGHCTNELCAVDEGEVCPYLERMEEVRRD